MSPNTGPETGESQDIERPGGPAKAFPRASSWRSSADSQISVTLNTYTHVDTSRTHATADRMEQVWPSKE